VLPKTFEAMLQGFRWTQRIGYEIVRGFAQMTRPVGERQVSQINDLRQRHTEAVGSETAGCRLNPDDKVISRIKPVESRRVKD
jgi:hypothetical protein